MEPQRVIEVVNSAHLITQFDVTRNRRWGYVDPDLQHDVALDAALATITTIGGAIDPQTALDQNRILMRQVNARLKRAERNNIREKANHKQVAQTHFHKNAHTGSGEESVMFDEHSALELREFLQFLVKQAKPIFDQAMHAQPHHLQHALREHYVEHHEVDDKLLRKAKHEFGRTAKRFIKVRLHLLHDHIQHDEERMVLQMLLAIIENDTLDEMFHIAEELDDLMLARDSQSHPVLTHNPSPHMTPAAPRTHGSVHHHHPTDSGSGSRHH